MANKPKLTPTGRVSRASSSAERSRRYEDKQRAKGLVRLSLWVPRDQVDQIRSFVSAMQTTSIKTKSNKTCLTESG